MWRQTQLSINRQKDREQTRVSVIVQSGISIRYKSMFLPKANAATRSVSSAQRLSPCFPQSMPGVQARADVIL